MHKQHKKTMQRCIDSTIYTGFKRCPPTWTESDADVLWGHLRAADGGIDLHFDLWLLNELCFTASTE